MNILLKIRNSILMPVCRIYSKRFTDDKPVDSIMKVLSSIDFWIVHKYWPDLINPKSFEEKICNRMLFNRDPLFTKISDKLRVRDHVAGRVGAEYLVPLLWSGEDPETIPFNDLPEKFVIKANHGCGYNVIVKDKQKLDRMETISKLKKWLGENFCTDKYLGTAWAYRDIKPIIFVESFLEDNGQVPNDYKFFCFSGRAEYLQMNFDRFGDPREKIFDRDFKPLDVWQGIKQHPGKVLPPDNYSKMIELAETLASDFDFIRVDLYNAGGKIYFGELTCYPAGGNARWIPRKYDFLLGEKWK